MPSGNASAKEQKPCSTSVAWLGDSRNGCDAPVRRSIRYAATSSGPPPRRALHLIRPSLLGGRELRHHRDNDVGQPCAGRTVAARRREGSEDPGGTLVEHQVPRAVDRVDDADPPHAVGGGADGKGEHDIVVDPLHHDADRVVLRPVLGEPLDHDVLADAIDLVDHIRRDEPGHTTQRGDPGVVAVAADLLPDRGAERGEETAEAVEVVAARRRSMG